MKEFFLKLLGENSEVSSGRLINLCGAVIGALLIVADFVASKHLNYDTFAIYLAYSGGVYGLSKSLNAFVKG